MRRLLIEATLIFVSVLGSFSIDRYRSESKEKEELNDSVITLGKEIESNLIYAKEYLKQLKNKQYINEYMLQNFSNNIKVKELYQMHDKNPFLYEYDVDGKIVYQTKYELFHIKNFIGFWNAWEPNTVFFRSMLNSGKLLEIKNDQIRKEIEFIYTKHQERIHNLTQIIRNQTEESSKWWKPYQIMNSNNSPAFIFENNRNNELKFYLQNIVNFNRGRIVGVENYIKSLNNVIKLISSEYKEMKD